MKEVVSYMIPLLFSIFLLAANIGISQPFMDVETAFMVQTLLDNDSSFFRKT